MFYYYIMDIGLLYRQYNMNCISKPKLYNSNYEDQCLRNKIALGKVLTDPNIDTIGKNIDNPEEWSIPDGKYHLLLETLNIDQNNPVIQETIKKRFKAKHSLMGKFVGGKRTKRTKRKYTKQRYTKRNRRVKCKSRRMRK